ncbi:MAG: archease [Syntrophobacteraceae bacterium]
MPFEFHDEIATADVAFEAWGQTIEEMFIAAAEATCLSKLPFWPGAASSGSLSRHLFLLSSHRLIVF